MTFFESLGTQQIVLWCGFVVVLLIFNELVRRSKLLNVAVFVALPLYLTFFVWPETAKPGTHIVGMWFFWAKVYSVLALCILFLILKVSKQPQKLEWALLLIPIFLTVNILEAVVREFQVYGVNEIQYGIHVMGGNWNIVNGIAGILNIIAISGWAGIKIDKNQNNDVVWPDQRWFWIIGYTVWNFAYIYNCISVSAFYTAGALLAAALIANFYAKHAWLQHRVYTLAFLLLLSMCVPDFFEREPFTANASYDPNAFMFVSCLSLLVNLLLVVFHFYKAKQNKVSILKGQSVYGD